LATVRPHEDLLFFDFHVTSVNVQVTGVSLKPPRYYGGHAPPSTRLVTSSPLSGPAPDLRPSGIAINPLPSPRFSLFPSALIPPFLRIPSPIGKKNKDALPVRLCITRVDCVFALLLLLRNFHVELPWLLSLYRSCPSYSRRNYLLWGVSPIPVFCGTLACFSLPGEHVLDLET